MILLFFALLINFNSFFELLRLSQIFEIWSSLKLNLDKAELCEIGVKKGVHLAFCGRKVVNLDKDTVKILGAHLSYMLFLDSRNFVETISKIKEILSIWSYRALTLISRVVSRVSLKFLLCQRFCTFQA